MAEETPAPSSTHAHTYQHKTSKSSTSSSQSTFGLSAKATDRTENILSIGFIIAIIGFFLLLIFQGIDNLFTDVLDDIGSFPGLKQVLGLLGTLANALSSFIKGIVGIFSSSSGSSS